MLYELFLYPTDSGNIKLTIYFDHHEYQVFAELNECMSIGTHKNKRKAVKYAIKELITAYESINP
jgi:hypothetical protein